MVDTVFITLLPAILASFSTISFIGFFIAAAQNKGQRMSIRDIVFLISAAALFIQIMASIATPSFSASAWLATVIISSVVFFKKKDLSYSVSDKGLFIFWTAVFVIIFIYAGLFLN